MRVMGLVGQGAVWAQANGALTQHRPIHSQCKNRWGKLEQNMGLSFWIEKIKGNSPYFRWLKKIK
jgi:hypothetical protein